MVFGSGEAQDETVFEREAGIDLSRGGRGVGAVYKHMERHGSEWSILKRQSFHLGYELYPDVRHFDLSMGILAKEIIGNRAGRCRHKARADVQGRPYKMRSAVVEHPAERIQSAGERPRGVNAAALTRPEPAGRIARQHHERKSVGPFRVDDIEQIFIADAAFPADERYFIRVENDGSAFGAAVRTAAVDVARYFKETGGIEDFGIGAGDFYRSHRMKV